MLCFRLCIFSYFRPEFEIDFNIFVESFRKPALRQNLNDDILSGKVFFYIL